MGWFKRKQQPVDDLLQPEELEQWFRKEGKEIHEAYGEECEYDGPSSSFIPTKNKQYQDLKIVLSIYRKAYPDSDLDVAQCSWEDVLDQMAQAKSNYDSNIERSRIRRPIKKLIQASEYITEYLDLIPDDYGLCFVKGGLALVFKAAGQRVENREKILQAFENIPDIIQTVDLACKLFGSHSEEKLPELAQNLYGMLSSDIPTLVKILLDKDTKFKWLLESFQLGIPEAGKIDEIVSRVTKAENSLKGRVGRIIFKITAAIHGNTAKSVEILQEVLSTTGKTQTGVGQISDNVEVVRTQNDEILQQLGEVKDAVTAMVANLGEKSLEAAKDAAREQSRATFAAEAKTMFRELMIENRKLRQALSSRPEAYSRPRTPIPNSIPLPRLTPLSLLQILNVPLGNEAKDMNFVLKQGNNFSTMHQGRARWLMKTEQFRRWLAGEASSLLLVDGCMDFTTGGRVSPMSVLCATIIGSLLELDGFITLHFFCGQHLDPRHHGDPISGPEGLIRSLIAQLVLYPGKPRSSLSFIRSQKFWDDCGKRNLDALCEVFRQLVKQVPSYMTIFCIIDGVSWYEQSDWVDSLLYIVGMFEAMVRDITVVAKVRLLMTNPNESMRIRNEINKDWQYVSLAARNVDYTPLSTQSTLMTVTPQVRPGTPSELGNFTRRAIGTLSEGEVMTMSLDG